jgi:hypothetical protein
MSQPEASVSDRLATLREQLIELFLAESNPAKWPGDKTAAERGDRFWTKRNAEATGRLAVRAFQLHALAAALPSSGSERTPEEDDSIEAEATRLEQQGVRLLKRHLERRRGRGQQ